MINMKHKTGNQLIISDPKLGQDSCRAASKASDLASKFSSGANKYPTNSNHCLASMNESRSENGDDDGRNDLNPMMESGKISDNFSSR